MKGSKTYRCISLLQTGFPLAAKIATIVLFCSLFMPVCGFTQEESGYDEIGVIVNVQRVGSVEVSAIIKNETAYLSVSELFDYLKINNHPTEIFDAINGFFMDPQAVFLIDKTHSLITYKGKTVQVDSGAIMGSETGLYLRADYFDKIFELDCTFSFRSLSVLLTTNLELPVIREMRQSAMRSNMGLLRGDWKADTIVHHRSPMFNIGMADWSVMTRQQVKKSNDAYLNLALGATVAGGETNVTLNYHTGDPLNEKQQYYQWRKVDNSNPYLRQVIAGKFYSQSIATIYTPVIGVQVTNTPTLFRRSFGTYTLSNITDPGWMVELYVNEVLISYVKADASGFFTFEVPLVYGNSVVKLRFYGPFGEERTKEGNILVPFNFLPLNELNYTVSAGVVEDSVRGRFSRATLNYGLTRHITVGGGMEYLSSIRSNTKIPFVNTAFRLAPNLMLSAEYAYRVRTKGLLTYRLPSNLQLELNYTKYVKGQTAISYNYLEERNLLLTVPFHAKNFSAFTRLTINHKVFPDANFTTGEMLLSVSAFRMSANVTTSTFYNTPDDMLIYSTMSLNFRAFHRITLIPQVQYEYRTKRVSMLRGQMDKQFCRNGFLTMFYEKNYYYHMDNAGLGMRYDFAFAQTYFSATRSNHVTSFIQSARGSLMFDPKTGYMDAGSRPSVGRGGIVIMPFLDINCNGKRDADEPKAFGLKLRVREGNVQYLNSDTSIRLSNLEPYVNYSVALDSNSFDNISWRLNKKTYSIYVEANQFQLIEVPVSVAGEVSGMVYLDDPAGKKGVGKITVSIFNSESVLVKKVQTEGNGYFDFLGLPPGSYTARIDAEQLNRLHLVSSNSSVSFQIARSKDGDVADGLEFLLHLP